MATITERDGRFTAQIRVLGFRSHARTFGSEEEARSWAAEMDDHLRRLKAKLKRDGHSGDGPILDSSAPRSLADVMALPRQKVEDAIGIYFLFKGDACVYVGQSRQVHARIHQHRQAGQKAFDSYAWISVAPDRLDETEVHYINLLQPKLNKRSCEVARITETHEIRRWLRPA